MEEYTVADPRTRFEHSERFMQVEFWVLKSFEFFSPPSPKQTLEPPKMMETPQSLGPQCRAPVILPSIGGDDDEEHYDDDEDDPYEDIWFPQRTKTGEIVRFFCSRLLVELC